MDEAATNHNNTSTATKSGKGKDPAVAAAAAAASSSGRKQRGSNSTDQNSQKRNAARRPPHSKYGKPRRAAPRPANKSNDDNDNNNNNNSKQRSPGKTKDKDDVINEEKKEEQPHKKKKHSKFKKKPRKDSNKQQQQQPSSVVVVVASDKQQSKKKQNKHFIDLALIDNGQYLPTEQQQQQHDVITDNNNNNNNNKKKKRKKKNPRMPSAEHQANKAKKALTKQIQACIQDNTSEALTELLQSHMNANIALDRHTLESLLHYLVQAAMFDDANIALNRYCEEDSVDLGMIERCLVCLPQNMRRASPYVILDYILALSRVANFANKAVRSYWLRVVQGVVLEFVEECTSCRDRICSAAMPIVSHHVEVNSFNHLIVHLNNNNSSDWRAGDVVGLLPHVTRGERVTAEALDKDLMDGSIMRVQEARLTIKVSSTTQDILPRLEKASGKLRVDKLANRMALTRQIAAVCSICDAVDVDAVDDIDDVSSSIQGNVFSRILVGGDDDDVINGVPKLCSEIVSTTTPDDDVTTGLNTSQQAAILAAVRRRVSLIQGPPGTGKTAVALRIIRHWCDTNLAEDNGCKILACSDSNIAVDNLVAGCAAAGLEVVRLGRPEAITNPRLLQYTLMNNNNNNNNNLSNNNNKQLRNAQVICCTCMGAVLGASTIINKVNYMLVDEATQCTEAAILVPIALASTSILKSVVLIGDHCQLPPTVLSTLATRHCASDIPLFTRLRLQSNVAPLLLNTQYRMHPAISMFVSDLFYGGLLIDGVHPHQRRPLLGFPWPRAEFPVAFVPIRCSNNNGEQTDEQTNSKYNTAEAHAAVDVVEMLLEGGQCTVHDIAIVTPYIAQVRLIRRLLRRLNYDTVEHITNQDAVSVNNIEVSSTDGFQGREKEAVIFSAVRSNAHGNIGFTSDWRRVNVSFTRARRALIVIGDDVTLRRGDAGTWSPWLAWADAHGVNMDKPGVMRGRYDPEQLRRVRGVQENILRDYTLKAVSVLNSTAANQVHSTDGDDGIGIGIGPPLISIEDDIANMANADGHWDDSSDDDADNDEEDGEGVSSSYNESSRNTSVADLSAAVDAWDL